MHYSFAAISDIFLYITSDQADIDRLTAEIATLNQPLQGGQDEIKRKEQDETMLKAKLEKLKKQNEAGKKYLETGMAANAQKLANVKSILEDEASTKCLNYLKELMAFVEMARDFKLSN
ncbi:hypothetical protein DL98DRAFT_610560 [Cadophora sp. DSE1049]|nr:hypothetical protein DL98DRAFT_610560 [Cadophora sp. DSE1049]